MEAAAATGNQRASSGSTVVSTEAPEKRRWARHNSEIALCVANGPRPRRNTSAPLRFFRRGSIRGPPPAAETAVEAEAAWNNKRDVGSLGTNSNGSNNAARNLTRGGVFVAALLVAGLTSSILHSRMLLLWVFVHAVRAKSKRRCRGTEPAATRHNLDWQQREAETAFKPHQCSMPLPLGPKQPRGRNSREAETRSLHRLARAIGRVTALRATIGQIWTVRL